MGAKILFLIVALLSFSSFNSLGEEIDTVLDLVKDDIYISQSLEPMQKFKKKVKLLRYKSTPVQVGLLFKYNLKTRECVLWKDVAVIIPGHFELKCDNSSGTEVCSDVWISEQSVTEKRCQEFEEDIRPVFKKIVLDFGSASKLSNTAKEVFEIELIQTKIDSGKFDIFGRVLEASDEYEISSRSWLHKYQTLYFVKN